LGKSEGDEVSLNSAAGWQLGTAESIRNWTSEGNVEISLLIDGKMQTSVLGVPTEAEALYLTVISQAVSDAKAFLTDARGFTYLSAERLGPRNLLAALAVPAHKLEVGERGEFCAQVLDAWGSKPLHYPERLHPNSQTSPSLLKYEVERWLSDITTSIEIEVVPHAGSAVSALQFRTPGGDWVRAPNMGFGVSYALPIVLAGLTAIPGGILLVENPEAHLHPAGQSRMGSFLAWLAGKGVQVVLETHSDHVLNGIRLAIGEHRYIECGGAIVHFFDSDKDGKSLVSELAFNSNGGMSEWPKGFFDQYQIDVASLGRIRRRG
jgi:predicted ATPase